MAAQMHAAQAPGLVEMRVGAFDELAPLPQEPLAAGAANPATIRIDRVAGRRLPLPRASSPIRLRDSTQVVTYRYTRAEALASLGSRFTSRTVNHRPSTRFAGPPLRSGPSGDCLWPPARDALTGHLEDGPSLH